MFDIGINQGLKQIYKLSQLNPFYIIYSSLQKKN